MKGGDDTQLNTNPEPQFEALSIINIKSNCMTGKRKGQEPRLPEGSTVHHTLGPPNYS